MTTLQEQTDINGDPIPFCMYDILTMTMLSVPKEDLVQSDTGDITLDAEGWPLLNPRPDVKREYVAGPMRGYPLWNFPAFDAARNKRLALGIQVISPADLDRARGFQEEMTDFSAEAFSTAMRIDTYALLQCTGIFLIKGWEASTGAKYELAVAEKIGLDITFDDDAVEGRTIIEPDFRVAMA